jgi:hypothetical protein
VADDEIADLTARLGGADHREVRQALIGALFERYLRRGGSESDGDTLLALCDEALADDGLGPGRRLAAELIGPLVVLIRDTAASRMRGMPPSFGTETLRLGTEWLTDQGDGGPDVAAVAAAGQRLEALLTRAELPEAVRPVVELLASMATLMADIQRPGADGSVSPDVLRTLQTLAGTVPFPPDELAGGVDMRAVLEAFITFGQVEPALRGAGRGEAAPEALERLTRQLGPRLAGSFLEPVLRRERGLALATLGEVGGDPSMLRASLDEIERALADMTPGLGLYDDTLRLLAGITVIVAAHDFDPDLIARAADLAERLAERLDEPGSTSSPGDLALLRGMVLTLRSRRDGDPELTEHASAELRRAVQLLPPDHPLHPVATGQLAALLTDRRVQEGSRRDGAVAELLLGQATEITVRQLGGGKVDAQDVLVMRATAAAGRVVDLSDRGEPAELAAAVAELRDVLSGLPEKHLLRGYLTLMLGMGQAAYGARTGDHDQVRAGLELLGSGGDASAVDSVVRVIAEFGAVAGTAMGSLLDQDPAALDAALARLRGLRDSPLALPEQRVGLHGMLGALYEARHDWHGHIEDLDAAIAAYGQALVLLEPLPGSAALPNVLRRLAVAQRRRGLHAGARANAVAGLEAVAGEVLLQSGAAHAIEVARVAAADAQRLAEWCLQDGDLPAAVDAIELGRALVLHANTCALRVPALLRTAGQARLAGGWEAELAAVDAPAGGDILDQVPTGLRHQVLRVLRSTPLGGRLSAAPGVDTVVRTLGAIGAAGLAYLLPHPEDAEGMILLVRADGSIDSVAAPALHLGDDRLRDFLGADGDPDPAARAAALPGVCDWAWQALVEPTRGALAGDGPVRLVVVPAGPLALVPWHAARTPAGDGHRYAGERLVLSYAASARQLIEVAARPRLPLTLRPVIVADPSGELVESEIEAEQVAAAFYPGAELFGGPVSAAGEDDLDWWPDELPAGAPGGAPGGAAAVATPDAVLARLPGAGTQGASLLHLCCHGRIEGSPEQSYLLLAGGARLRVSEILAHAQGRRPSAPGPLVLLSACSSDVTASDFDEALTLATAFLAAGAVGVIGSLWPVSDRLTPVVMYAFHHFLRREGLSPPYALHAAQCWLADRDRPPLPGMPAVLLGSVQTYPLHDLEVWAAFGHHGH